MGQRKAFCEQRIPESSCARRKTIDIDILVRSGKGDRKVMQQIKITSGTATRMRKCFSHFR